MKLNQYRVRLLEVRRKVNEIIETELSFLDDEEVRLAKEINNKPPVIIVESINKIKSERE